MDQIVTCRDPVNGVQLVVSVLQPLVDFGGGGAELEVEAALAGGGRPLLAQLGQGRYGHNQVLK